MWNTNKRLELILWSLGRKTLRGQESNKKQQQHFWTHCPLNIVEKANQTFSKVVYFLRQVYMARKGVSKDLQEFLRPVPSLPH